MSDFTGRKNFPRPLADFVVKAIHPALAKRGFSQTGIVLNWQQIVGPQVAAICQPLQLQWPVRPKGKVEAQDIVQPATLVLRVDGAFALEVQFMTPLLIERVNVFFGWACIGKIALRQGPLLKAAPKRMPAAPVSQQTLQRVEQMVPPMQEPLRQACLRLGHGLLEDIATNRRRS